MEAARAWGVPRSIFLGRVVGAGEPLWLPDDRWWALALQEAESGLCRDCGQPLTESTHPDHEFSYDASVARCHGCTAASRRMKSVQEGGTAQEGLQVRVFRREE